MEKCLPRKHLFCWSVLNLKRQRPKLRLEHEETDSKVHPAAVEPDLQEVMSGCERVEAEQQVGRRSRSDCRPQRNRQVAEAQTLTERLQTVWVHGLSVERYRDVYNSVLQPSVLAALSSWKHAEYVSQVLELKQRLWTALSRPRLQETLMEDGRVEVKEIFDLT